MCEGIIFVMFNIYWKKPLGQLKVREGDRKIILKCFLGFELAHDRFQGWALVLVALNLQVFFLLG
jgi:hypothetical protein